MRIQQMNGLNNPKQRNSDRIKKKKYTTRVQNTIRDMLVIQRYKYVENKKMNKNILWKQQL